jgi:hypothetical protein
MSDLGSNTRIRKTSVRDYNLKELAVIYDVSKYIMRKKLKHYKKQIGKRDGYLYSVNQVTLIFTLVALPSDVEVIRV